MEERRKMIGVTVLTQRETQGYRSQPALAEAAGISPRSVAKVEAGDPGVGPKVLRALARTLGFADNAFVDYLQSGDSALLNRPEPILDHSREPNFTPPLKVLTLTRDQLMEAAKIIADIDGEDAADEWLLRAMEKRAEARKDATDDDQGRDAG